MLARLPIWLLLASVAGWMSGCGSTSDDPCDKERDPHTTPQLDDCHPGWKQQRCAPCHELPVENHLVDRVPDCAGCHGGNGACRPVDPDHEHLQSEDCQGCHGETHQYTESGDCVFCHFADIGVADCD